MLAALQRLLKVPETMVGRRHHLLTVGGGVIGLAGAAAGAVGATTGQRLAIAGIALVPLAMVISLLPERDGWLRRIGPFALFGCLVLWIAAAMLAIVPFRHDEGNPRVLVAFIGGFSPMILMSALAPDRGLRKRWSDLERFPIAFEWRLASAHLTMQWVLLGYFVVCPQAPSPGPWRWGMLAGLVVTSAGLIVLYTELRAAGRTDLPVATARTR